MSVSASANQQPRPTLGLSNQAFRAVSIVAALSVPISTFAAEFIIGGGGTLHLLLAALAVVAGTCFLLRTRRGPGNGRALVAATVIASLAWIIGVISLAFVYGWLMKDFH